MKDREDRVSLTPGGVSEFVSRGHQVLVERCAGAGSGFPDSEYERAGATGIDSHAAVFEQADLIIKVKEPVPSEYDLLRQGQMIFTYFHLAADESLTRALIESGTQAIAYETVQLDDGSLPLLTPMSEVAGRMSVQIGAHFLERSHGGSGVLLGGVPGVKPGNVVILGGGTVGANAALIALGMGANTTIIDRNISRLQDLEYLLHGRLTTQASDRHAIEDAVASADLLIGAVLITGAKAPRLVDSAMIRQMTTGSVVVDVSVDQGGCIESARPTTHSSPTYEVDGVIHYCVTNMPGAVPRTSTNALSNVTLRYALKLADHGLVESAQCDPALAAGINILNGKVTHRGVAEAFGLDYTPWESAL